MTHDSIVMSSLAYYFPSLVAVVFISSVVCVLFAVLYSNDSRVRKSFIAVFLSCLLVVNIAPISSPLPFTHLHKYTGTSSNPATYYEIYVVDESGDELRYDGEAARPAGNLIEFGRGIATGYTRSTASSTAEYLLAQARSYRQRIESGQGIGRHVDFPPHALGDGWNSETFARYEDFVGLRVYYVEHRYTESGLDVEDRDRTVVAKLTSGGELVRNDSTR